MSRSALVFSPPGPAVPVSANDVLLLSCFSKDTAGSSAESLKRDSGACQNDGGCAAEPSLAR